MFYSWKVTLTIELKMCSHIFKLFSKILKYILYFF